MMIQDFAKMKILKLQSEANYALTAKTSKAKNIQNTSSTALQIKNTQKLEFIIDEH